MYELYCHSGWILFDSLLFQSLAFCVVTGFSFWILILFMFVFFVLLLFFLIWHYFRHIFGLSIKSENGPTDKMDHTQCDPFRRHQHNINYASTIDDNGYLCSFSGLNLNSIFHHSARAIGKQKVWITKNDSYEYQYNLILNIVITYRFYSRSSSLPLTFSLWSHWSFFSPSLCSMMNFCSTCTRSHLSLMCRLINPFIELVAIKNSFDSHE